MEFFYFSGGVGVQSAEIVLGDRHHVVVIGDVDSIELTTRLRKKVGCAMLMSVNDIAPANAKKATPVAPADAKKKKLAPPVAPADTKKEKPAVVAPVPSSKPSKQII